MRNISKTAAVIIGILLIIGGIYAFSNPMATVLAAGLMLGIVAIVKGIGNIGVYRDLKRYSQPGAVFSVIAGIILIVIGLILVLYPRFATGVALYIVALWFLLDAVTGLMAARRMTGGLQIFTALLYILVLFGGIALLFNPLLALITLPIVIGFTLIADGVGTLMSAFVRDAG